MSLAVTVLILLPLGHYYHSARIFTSRVSMVFPLTFSSQSKNALGQGSFAPDRPFYVSLITVATYFFLVFFFSEGRKNLAQMCVILEWRFSLEIKKGHVSSILPINNAQWWPTIWKVRMWKCWFFFFENKEYSSIIFSKGIVVKS